MIINYLHSNKNREFITTRSNYDYIANEYYNKIHKTSRNFDAATLDFLERKRKYLNIDPDGLVLELGAGRGNTIKYCQIDHDKLIQSDLSKSMLSLSNREPCFQRIVCDALDLPFSNSTFSLVTAFLYDPYNIHCPKSGLSLYKSIFDLLQKGGVFLGTLPHIIWGKTLRNIRKQRDIDACFLTRDNKMIRVNSFLMDDDSIKSALSDVGLELIEMHDLKLPRKINSEDISKDIIDPAIMLGIDKYSLPIVKLIWATK